MQRKTIHTEKAPAAIGPYSQAIQYNSIVYTSGQIGIDPATGELCSQDVVEQAKQVLANLAAIAKASGSKLNNAVKLNVYLTDLANFQAVNAVMAEVLSEPYPARACVEVSALPKGALIEIDAVLAL